MQVPILLLFLRRVYFPVEGIDPPAHRCGSPQFGFEPSDSYSASHIVAKNNLSLVKRQLRHLLLQKKAKGAPITARARRLSSGKLKAEKISCCNKVCADLQKVVGPALCISPQRNQVIGDHAEMAGPLIKLPLQIVVFQHFTLTVVLFCMEKSSPP
ncbi:hypothetical protein CDAR_615321 [Caerostris darwini]|uniref:Uncharacterized protein n=1 Tax=Caerostris darwini TaxID=1538125 RepID=A0AAV4RUM9_9ARAC|nr:hypothetical protein CDAR_615321 [Caerostris darwini]